jgi:hypothetical protein
MGKKEEKQLRLNISGFVDLLMDALMGGWIDETMCGWTDGQTERQAGKQAGRQMGRRTEKQTS